MKNDKPIKLRFEKETLTLRTVPENYCVCSFQLFSEGGHTDAAVLKELKQIAHLIAAAPEMFEALEYFRTIVPLLQNTKNKEQLFRADKFAASAIAKAKGEVE